MRARPGTQVRKEWYKGLDKDHVDHSHPDVHDAGLANDSELKAPTIRRLLQAGGCGCVERLDICCYMVDWVDGCVFTISCR